MSGYLSKCAAALASFMRDSRAGATAYSAVAIILMTVGGAALIIDHNQLVGQRDLLQSAADAASMSATLELSGLPDSMPDTEIQERLLSVARKYAVLNVLGNVNDPDLKADNIGLTLAIDRAAGTVGATVRADIGQTVMSERFLGYSGPGTIARKGGVESLENPVEVVLAIDISGSMARDLDGSWISNSPDSRMAVVKRAAIELVSILEPGLDKRVAVGLVPWHFTVRMPDPDAWEAKGWAGYPASRRYASVFECFPQPSCASAAETAALPPRPEVWRGCLDEQRVLTSGEADYTPVERSLDHPTDNSFAMAYFPAAHGIGYQCLAAPLPSGYRRQRCYFGDDGASSQWRQPPQFGCDDTQPAIQPLSYDRIAVEKAIEGLAPIGRKTHSALGVLWAQRLLQHEWRDVWGTETGAPDGETHKAIVLLTDGRDTQCRERGDPGCERGGGVSRTQACALAKGQGTEIFVIAAMVPDLIETEFAQTLRDCATSDDHVFLNNATAEALERVFAEIAGRLIALRRIY